MAGLFKIRTLLTIVGVILLALFIWYAGPLFAFGSYRPLESELARLVLIGLIVVGMVVAKLLKRLRANKASDNLIAAVVKQSAADNRPSAEAQQLRERFEEAVATLKQKRRSGHSLYDLPWYVIIGAPGSGASCSASAVCSRAEPLTLSLTWSWTWTWTPTWAWSDSVDDARSAP